MKTPITTAQAMSHPDVALTINTLGEMADELRAERDALELRIGAMIVERSDAFFKVIQERDAYVKCADDMAAAHKVERDALQSELDLARRKLAVLSNADALENLYQVGLKQEFDITALTKERDALKDAAKLALKALKRIDDADIRLDHGEQLSITKAIAALKAVLK